MNEGFPTSHVVVFFVGMLIGVVGVAQTSWEEVHDLYKAAIKRGYAHYDVAENGMPTFQWNENSK